MQCSTNLCNTIRSYQNHFSTVIPCNNLEHFLTIGKSLQHYVMILKPFCYCDSKQQFGTLFNNRQISATLFDHMKTIFLTVIQCNNLEHFLTMRKSLQHYVMILKPFFYFDSMQQFGTLFNNRQISATLCDDFETIFLL